MKPNTTTIFGSLEKCNRVTGKRKKVQSPSLSVQPPLFLLLSLQHALQGSSAPRPCSHVHNAATAITTATKCEQLAWQQRAPKLEWPRWARSSRPRNRQGLVPERC